MKKFLSLVLALIMTMSLVTVSAGATDFKDDGKINYEEAVSVMSAVKVIDGYADGSFNPQGTLTRGAAAKIICNLILGPTTAAALHADTAPYKDVPVDHTFAGYIAYCAEQGIISGYADGAFRPAATLTNYAFLKMLLGALGYDSEIEGFVGENWSIQVAKRALAIGLTKGYEGTFVGTNAATREEACLYALNTLTATMVDYDAKITANVNGATVTIGNSLATDVKWNIASSADGNIKDDGYVQFAEKYFPKLELEIGNGIYGRPANTWKLKKTDIGTFTSIEPTQVYTETTKGKDIYKDLGKAVCAEYDWTAFVNGKEVPAKELVVPTKDGGSYPYTGEGTVCEIYVNDDDETVTVVEINYYLGQVSKVKSDDDGEYINVSIIDSKVSLDDRTFYVEGYEEDDYVVFTVDYNDDKDFVIGEVCEPVITNGEVSRVEKEKDGDNAYLRVDGEKIVYSDHMTYDLDDSTNNDHPALAEEYNLFLDPNGYILGYSQTEKAADKYLYVLDSDEEMGDWRAKVMFADGTTATVDLEDEYENFAGGDTPIAFYSQKTVTNIDGWIWKYSVDDDGVYSLKQVVTEIANPVNIRNGKAYMEVKNNQNTDNVSEIIVDRKTTFVDVDGKSAYVGYPEVPDIDDADIKYVKNGKNVQAQNGTWSNDGKIADIVFVLSGEIFDSNSTYFMIADEDSYESEKHGSDSYRVYDKAYVDGEKTELKIRYNALKDAQGNVINNGKLSEGVLYQVKKTVDDGEYITLVNVVKAVSAFEDVYAVGDNAFWLTNDGTQKKNKYDTDDDTIFVYVEEDEDGGDFKITTGNINDLKDQNDFTPTVAYVAKTSNSGNTADLVYIYVKEAPAGQSGSSVAGKGDIKWVLNIIAKDTGAVISTKTYTQEGVPAGEYAATFADVNAAGYWGALPAGLVVVDDNSTVKVVADETVTMTYTAYISTIIGV